MQKNLKLQVKLFFLTLTNMKILIIFLNFYKDEPPHTNDTILQSLEVGSNSIHTITASLSPTVRDNSIYRTPSGSFYCKPCNVTLATEVLFNQHLDSKKHIKSNAK